MKLLEVLIAQLQQLAFHRGEAAAYRQAALLLSEAIESTRNRPRREMTYEVEAVSSLFSVRAGVTHNRGNARREVLDEGERAMLAALTRVLAQERAEDQPRPAEPA